MARVRLVAMLLFLFQGSLTSLPVGDNTKQLFISTQRVVNYLVTYGYLPKKTTVKTKLLTTVVRANRTKSVENLDKSLYTDGEIAFALRDFQEFMGLPRSGRLDQASMSVLLSTRCGTRDKTPHAPWLPMRKTRKRRYSEEGSSWQGKTTLNYIIATPSKRHSLRLTNQTLWKAFRQWAQVSPLTFRWCDNQTEADIVIRFLKGNHGDSQAFDGPGDILGHAFYPSQGSQIHFDDEEVWAMADEKVRDPSKRSLLLVATHEIGHTLGLAHSTSRPSIMSPVFNTLDASDPSLSADDIAGIQSIYGKCNRPIRSMLSWIRNGRTYAFSETMYWQFNDTQKSASVGYPKDTSSFWRRVPDNIDEAFLWGYNWRTYFFKGSEYYRFHDSLGMVEDGYPQSIASGWPGIPDNIDAAFTWSDKVSFFFKGSLCYRFDNGNDRVHTGYPKNISAVWPGIPDDIDTAFRYYWDGLTYFFKGHYYWQWDDANSVASQPFLISHGWKNICDV